MERRHIKIAVIAALICIVWVECIVFGGLGLGVVAGVVAAYIGFGSLHAMCDKEKGKFISPYFVAVVALTACFGLHDNLLLKWSNSIGLILLIGIHLQVSFGLAEGEACTPEWSRGILRNLVKMPFVRQKAIGELAKEATKDVKKERIQTLKQVLIGFVIAIPLMCVVASLLSAADAAFESACDTILAKMDIDQFVEWGIHAIVWCPLFVSLLSTYHFCCVKKAEVSPALETGVASQVAVRRYWNTATTLTVTGGIASIYCVYVLAQLNYFTAAFGGGLPGTYTYAMYARRGFFELLPIILFNGLIIGLMGMKLKARTTMGQCMVRGLSTFYSVFTGFLIVSGLAKMYLYMNLYGLTLKRVYATWLLVVCFLLVVCMLIKLYRSHFPLGKYFFTLFVVAYIGLNYMHVDKLVCTWNEAHGFDRPRTVWSGCDYASDEAREWYSWNITYAIERAKAQEAKGE